MALPRSINLQWQREVIERWLNSSDTPLDARPGLLDMLRAVKEEMEELTAARNHRAFKQAGELIGEPDR